MEEDELPVAGSHLASRRKPGGELVDANYWANRDLANVRESSMAVRGTISLLLSWRECPKPGQVF